MYSTPLLRFFTTWKLFIGTSWVIRTEISCLCYFRKYNCALIFGFPPKIINIRLFLTLCPILLIRRIILRRGNRYDPLLQLILRRMCLSPNPKDLNIMNLISESNPCSKSYSDIHPYSSIFKLADL